MGTSEALNPLIEKPSEDPAELGLHMDAWALPYDRRTNGLIEELRIRHAHRDRTKPVQPSR